VDPGAAQRIASNPLKRIGQPEEVAAVILGLATTMTFVNGTIIPVDAAACCEAQPPARDLTWPGELAFKQKDLHAPLGLPIDVPLLVFLSAFAAVP
jgi:hypothetical protein